MKIRNFTIRLRLILGFALFVIMIVYLGIVALLDITNSTNATENIYNHPLTVSNAVRDINANILAMHRSMKDVALSENEAEMTKARIKVDRYEKDAFDKFQIVYKYFLGDHKDVDNAYKSFSDWKEIREEVIVNWIAGNKTTAINITKGKGADHVQKMLDDVHVMIDFASYKADEFYNITKKAERRSFNRLLIIIAISLILSTIIIIILVRSITIPIDELNKTAKSIESGNLDARNKTGYKDELNLLAVSFNKMTNAIKVRNQTVSGLSKISIALHGIVDLDHFANTLLTNYIELSGANMAAFYLLNEDTHTYSPIMAIGGSIDKLKPFSAHSAPGEFGHVLAKKSTYFLLDVKDDNHIRFESVTGQLLFREIVAVPIVVQGEVKAIIVCGGINKFKNGSNEIFVQSQTIISTSFGSLLANIQTKEFSEKLRKNNEALEMQSEELQEQAQELKSQSMELKMSSDNLYKQNIELDMQRREVEEANKLKSEFLSNMSHELRTPLNSINALSKVLIMQTSQRLEGEEANYLKIIERNGKRLLSLINDILDLSKVEAGKMDFVHSSFSINNTILQTIENLQSLADSKGLKIKFANQNDFIINSDESRLTQVITNILGNAIKFTDKGEVNIDCEEEDGYLSIKIKDTGVGIGKEVLPYIFNEFRQGDGTTSRKYEGTGLGLSISEKIVKALNGSISCDSEVGKGSVFTIKIPIGTMAPQSIKDIKSNEEHFTSGKTILVIDDDKRFVYELSEKLTSSGFNVIQATSGKEALEKARLYTPYAITLDIVMPDMDGWEVLQKLKANDLTRDIPVIVISNSDDSGTGVALGAVGYLQKPVQKERLLEEINKVCNNAGKILVVDDNEIDILNITNILQNENFSTDSCNNGNECLTVLESNIPDVLILDLMMPGKSGFQVLSEIREKENVKDLPVIIVTAKDLSLEEKEFLNDKASSIVLKDKAEDHIVKEVQRIIDRLKNSEKQNNKSPNILIIEDNETAIIQIRKTLENEGIVCNYANNGIQAMKFVEKTIPDGIILDLMMPEMDGFEVLDSIRSKDATRNIPVLILTAKTLNKSDLQRLASNNVKQLIQKGDVDEKQLIKVVNEMLGKVISKPIINKPEREVINIRPVDRNVPMILIVEDNPDNRVTLKAILGNKYILKEARDGEEGLEMIKSFLPDIVLLDMSLPKMDGFEVIREVRLDEKISNTKVIAVTAKAMKTDEQEIIAAGCDAYVSKPIDDEKLLSLINGFTTI